MSSTPTTTGKSSLTLIGLSLGAVLVLGFTLRTWGGPGGVSSSDNAETPVTTQMSQQPRSLDFTIQIPPNTSEVWAEVRANGATDFCPGDKSGIDTLYQNAQWQWVKERPNGVRAWRFQSKTSAPRTLVAYWDKSPKCDSARM